MTIPYAIAASFSIISCLLMPIIFTKYGNLRQHPAGIFTLICISESIACYLLLLPYIIDMNDFLEDFINEDLLKYVIF